MSRTAFSNDCGADFVAMCILRGRTCSRRFCVPDLSGSSRERRGEESTSIGLKARKGGAAGL